jgi:murein DD-endopeptidase MepM/ murein hydrolase activator NlpD
MRTLAAGRVIAWTVSIVIVLMGACITLGYWLASARTGDVAAALPVAAGAPIDARRPESRVVVDRLGDLSGRLTRLEIEAAELARRFNVAPTRNTLQPPDSSSANDDNAPRGGPWVPVNRVSDVTNDASGGYGTRISNLEDGIERLEASLDHIEGAAADRDLLTMAYPNRIPVQERMPRISSGFGVRRDPFTGRMARHMGLDIPAPYGTPVLASGGGRVLSAGFRGPYGNAIVIDHGHGLQTVYGHCSKLFVRAGQLVMPQQKIAAVGSTGRSTGPHLHFEVIRNGMRVEPGQVLATVLARNST